MFLVCFFGSLIEVKRGIDRRKLVLLESFDCELALVISGVNGWELVYQKKSKSFWGKFL